MVPTDIKEGIPIYLNMRVIKVLISVCYTAMELQKSGNNFFFFFFKIKHPLANPNQSYIIDVSYSTTHMYRVQRLSKRKKNLDIN